VDGIFVRFRRERQLPQQMPSDIPVFAYRNRHDRMGKRDIRSPHWAMSRRMPLPRRYDGRRRFYGVFRLGEHRGRALGFGERAVQFHIFIFL